MATQSELIGVHPDNTNIFGTWLNCMDIPVTQTKNHRSLTAINQTNGENLVEWLGEKIFKHHHSEYRIKKLQENFGKIGYSKYAQQHRKLPLNPMTQKGNATEIILSEYIESCLKKQLIKTYKLKYNPNADQAMKGDDTLLIDLLKSNQKLRVYLGEAKFRNTHATAKKAIADICKALSKDKKPLSYSYVVDELAKNPETEYLADLLDQFIIDDVKENGDLIYAGLLLSTRRTHDEVERHLVLDNPSFVLISIGIDNPVELIDKAFEKAEYFFNHPDEL